MLTNRVRQCALACTAFVFTTPCFALDDTFDTEAVKIHAETFADGLSHPWGLVFLPDRSALVTERDGRLRHVTSDGVLSEPIKGVPDVDARDQGGLLDVAIDPDFDANRLVYFSFSEAGADGTNSTAVARGKLSDDFSELTEVEVIFSQQPKHPSTAHFGGRLVFDGEGHLFITLGERSKEEFRGQAQDLDSHLGKIVRVSLDGSVPEDNPFVDQAGALPEIFSYGHRNIQGAAMNP